MTHQDKVNAIWFIRPNAKFVLRGEQLEWFDENQTEPTEAEITAGFVSYEKHLKAEAKLKADAKLALLDKLGITEDEAKLLLA